MLWMNSDKPRLRTFMQLTLQNLSKNYGSTRAVAGLSLTVGSGQVFGILGPNGSGKTTTLGMVLGVIRPSAGTIQVNTGGFAPQPLDRRQVGAILEKPLFYPWLNGPQNLTLVAKLRRVAKSDAQYWLKRLELDQYHHLPVGKYSLGMKQRLALAAALLGQPQLLILDEPTNGLDAPGIKLVRELIQEARERGQTVILASHILDEVEKVCSHLAILNQGQKIMAGAVDDVLKGEDQVEVGAEAIETLEQVLANCPFVLEHSRQDWHYLARLQKGVKATELNQYLVEKGATPNYLAARRNSLENYFLNLVGNGTSNS